MKLRRIALAEVAELEKIKERLVKEDRALAGKLEEMRPAQVHKEVEMEVALAALAGLLEGEASNRVVGTPVLLAMVAEMEADKVKVAKVEVAREMVRARARNSVSLRTKIATQSPKLVTALQAKERILQRIVTNRIRMEGPTGLAGV